jgi:hypothetical protein
VGYLERVDLVKLGIFLDCAPGNCDKFSRGILHSIDFYATATQRPFQIGIYSRLETSGDWRKLHNEELHNLYSSPNIIRMIKSRRMRWAGHVIRMGETRNACRILVDEPEGKRPLRRP